MNYIKIDVNKCKGCGLCITACPKNLIIKSKEINELGYEYVKQNDSEECTACGLCYIMCPDAAIEVHKDV